MAKRDYAAVWYEKNKKPSGQMETYPGAPISGRSRWLQDNQTLID